MDRTAARILLLPLLFAFAGTFSCRQAEEPSPEVRPYDQRQRVRSSEV